LERKSDDAARRGQFDDAVSYCVAAADCLARLLKDDIGDNDPNQVSKQKSPLLQSLESQGQTPTNLFVDRPNTVDGQVRESVVAQLKRLETRQKFLSKRKRQFDFLKSILTLQQEESVRRRESQPQQRRKTTTGLPCNTGDADGDQQQTRGRRGSSAATVKRRLSNRERERARKSGCVETVAHPLSPDANQQVAASRTDSFSLLQTCLDDARLERQSRDEAPDDPGLGVDEAAEMTRFRNKELSDRRIALEASLYEMSMNPPRSGAMRAVAGGGRGVECEDDQRLEKVGRSEFARIAEERPRKGGGGIVKGKGDVVGGKLRKEGDDKSESHKIHRLRLDNISDGVDEDQKLVDDLHLLSVGIGNPKHFHKLQLPPLEPPPVDIPSLSPMNLSLRSSVKDTMDHNKK